MNTDDGTHPGQDYVVRYATSPYQNGTLVLRFTAPPGRKELLAAIADYGVTPNSVSEISARPVPSLAARQDRRQQSPGYIGSPGLNPAQYQTTTSREKPKGKDSFSGGRILIVLLALFLGLVAINAPAASTGREIGSYHSGVADNRWEYCTDAIVTGSTPGQGLMGQLISDQPTDFPATPPNAAFLAGCLTAN